MKAYGRSVNVMRIKITDTGPVALEQ